MERIRERVEMLKTAEKGGASLGQFDYQLMEMLEVYDESLRVLPELLKRMNHLERTVASDVASTEVDAAYEKMMADLGGKQSEAPDVPNCDMRSA